MRIKFARQERRFEAQSAETLKDLVSARFFTHLSRLFDQLMRVILTQVAVDCGVAGIEQRRGAEGNDQLEGIVGGCDGEEFRCLHLARQPEAMPMMTMLSINCETTVEPVARIQR